jgi:hypothetical protein
LLHRRAPRLPRARARDPRDPAPSAPALGPRAAGAGLLLALGAVAALAQPAAYLPGRLFLTPAERAQLDALRAARPERAQTQAQVARPGAIDLPPPPPPEPFTMNGLVVRSSGPNTAWIDGEPVLGPQQIGKGLSVDTRGMGLEGVPVTVLGSGREVTLKPGQVYAPEQGAVSERVGGPPSPGP